MVCVTVTTALLPIPVVNLIRTAAQNQLLNFDTDQLSTELGELKMLALCTPGLMSVLMPLKQSSDLNRCAVQRP